MKKMLPRNPKARNWCGWGLMTLLLVASCNSAPKQHGRPAINSPTVYGDWDVLERSGREPKWKDNEQSGYFWGEGSGMTEAAAFVAAEEDMRTKAARFLKTDVNEVMVIRRKQVNDKVEEQIGQILKVGTDAAVHGMAVEESYRELRERDESQFGVSHVRKEWRVLVRGQLQ